MATSIFVNLPIKNIQRTREFWTQLGFTFNEAFSNEKALCLVISDNIFAMLLQEEFFKTFIKKDIADASKTKEVILALSAESKEHVDTLVNKAMQAGAVEPMESQTYDFMYYRTFEDPDGHHWEIIWMNPEFIPQQEAAAQQQ
jgi:predicted lactoylglutathione lyase